MRRERARRVGEWSPPEIRQLLRQFGAASRDLPSVTAALAMPEQAAHRVLQRLSRAGYVRRDPDRPDELRWCRTEQGDALARAGVGRPLSRARADRLLQGVLRRVGEVNRKTYFLCQVTAVGVFGSYRTDAPTLDAIDLVVRIVPKPPAPGSSDEVFRPNRRLPYWRFQKLLPRDEWPHWRERQVELYLLGETRSIVLHRFDDPLLRGQRVRLVFLAHAEMAPPTPHDTTLPEESADRPGS